MRELLQQGTKVKIAKSGYDKNQIYQVEYDYEDLIYLYGIDEPFKLHEIKKV